jgi:cell division septation protein DedD
VGVFAHQERVTLLEKKLLKLGFAPQIDTLESAEAPRWRVRIGPFLNDPALGSALQRLNQLGIQGMRVSSPQ